MSRTTPIDFAKCCTTTEYIKAYLLDVRIVSNYA